MLLVAIFWDLGKKRTSEALENLEEEGSDRNSTVEVEDFDEEAELQARIWNKFQREQRNEAFIVTKDRTFSRDSLASMRGQSAFQKRRAKSNFSASDARRAESVDALLQLNSTYQ